MKLGKKLNYLTTRIIPLLAFAAFIQIFSSCTDLFSSVISLVDDSSTSESSAETTVTTVPLGQEKTISVNLGFNSSRTAHPSTVSSLYWIITASNGNESRTVNGDGSSFTLTLVSGYSWTINATGKTSVASSETILKGSTTVDLTNGIVPASIDIAILPVSGVGTGSIDLSVSSSLTGAASLQACLINVDNSFSSANITGDASGWKYTRSNIASGVYELEFFVFDSSSNCIGSTTQTVQVWGGLTTDTWYTTDGSSTSTGQTTLTISSAQTSFFVTSGYSGVSTGSMTTPYSTLTDALARCTDSTKTYVFYISGAFSENINTQDINITIRGINGADTDKITGTGSGSVITSGGSLTLKNITVTGGSATNGGGIYFSGTTLTLENSTITANTATTCGGGIYMYAGTLNMASGLISYNSTISDSDTSQGGGGICLESGTTFTITSGTISENSATRGGGIHANGATVNLAGGTISTNTASSGGGVYLNASSTLNISRGTVGGSTESANTASYGAGVFSYVSTVNMSGGSVSYNQGTGLFINYSSTFKLTNGSITSNAIYLENNTSGSPYITLAGTLTNTIPIEIELKTYESNYEVLKPTASDTNRYVYKAIANNRFSISDTSYALTYNSSGYGILAAESEQITLYVSSTTGDDSYAGTQAAPLATIGQAITNGTTSYTSTTIVLLDNISLTSECTIPSGKTVTLQKDTADVTIDGNSSTRHFTINGGTLVLTDGITLQNGANTSGSGGSINILLGGVFDMRGGQIVSCSALTYGGAIYNEDGSIIMSGGTIGGSTENANTAANGGGAIFIHVSTFVSTLSGGTISYNTATGADNTDGGGGIYVMGSLNIEGCSISNNSSVSNGGGIFASNTATVNFTSGSITNNTATSNGGGVYSTSTFTHKNGAVISGNTATSWGGGVYVGGGSYTLEGSIDANTANYGGGVYIEDGNFNLSNNGIISNNTATYGGGIFYVATNTSSTLTLSAGSVTGNTADTNAGIYHCGNSLNILGSPKVSSNTLTDGTTPCNLDISSGKTINVTGKLTTDAQIGITASTGTFTSGYTSSGNTDAPSTFFTADNSIYEIDLSDDGNEAAIIRSSSVTYTTLSDAKSGIPSLADTTCNITLTGTIATTDITTLGSTIKSISESANVTVNLDLSGATLSELDDSTFDGCTYLTSLTLPDTSITSLPDSFICSTGISSFTIPSSVTTIEASVFYGCANLTSITIPANVTLIYPQAFASCTNLSSVIFTDTVNWGTATSSAGINKTTIEVTDSSVNATNLKQSTATWGSLYLLK